MRYIKILFGMFRMTIISMLSFGKIKFILPVRMERSASLSKRKGGQIILGKHVSMNNNAQISVTENACIRIGSFTGIGDNNVIVARDRIIIGDNVMIGPNVCIYDHDHVFRETGVMRDLGYETSPVIIEDNVWIGAGVTVLRGVTVGSGSVIGAGTVITKDVPKNSLVYNKRELVFQQRIIE